MTATRTAVITIAHGRHEHLRGQAWGLTHQTRPADVHVVVAMNDPQVAQVARAHLPGVLTPQLTVDGTDLPLAASRNAGAAAAIEAGAEHLIFLDVDCIPGPGTVARYHQVLLELAGTARPVVACGEVTYLPAVEHPADYRTSQLPHLARPHVARPGLGPEEMVWDGDVRLFWSLSFAITSPDWQRIGGFCEDYVGYGGEDTDFGQLLAAAGGSLLWVGGAPAYHQHHGSHSPPLHHLRSIVANANVFLDRWGWLPMHGWLEDFADRGLARPDSRSGRWQVSGQP